MPVWLAAWARLQPTVKDVRRGESDLGGEDDWGDEGVDASNAQAQSPWLEEGRMWNARRARQAYLEQRGLLVPVDAIERTWGAVGGLLKTRIEQMCDRCRQVADRTLDEAEQKLLEDFPAASGELSDKDAAALDEHAAEPIDDEPLPPAGGEPD